MLFVGDMHALGTNCCTIVGEKKDFSIFIYQQTSTLSPRLKNAAATDGLIGPQTQMMIGLIIYILH